MVTVYTQPGCQPCKATYRKLTELGVQFDVFDVSVDARAMQVVRDLGYQSVPVVVAPNGDHWGGFQPDRLKALV